MAAALRLAYCAFDKAKKLHVMFDMQNPFDLTLLIWCNEAQSRNTLQLQRKAERNPNRNYVPKHQRSGEARPPTHCR